MKIWPKDDTNRVIIPFPLGAVHPFKTKFYRIHGDTISLKIEVKRFNVLQGWDQWNELLAEARRGATKWWWRRRRRGRRDEIREDACIPSRLLVSSDCFASIRWCLYRYHVPSTRSLIPEGTPNKWNGALVLPLLPFHSNHLNLSFCPYPSFIDILSFLFLEIYFKFDLFNYTFYWIINLRIEKLIYIILKTILFF